MTVIGFFVLFCIVTALTRKDMAYMATIASLLGLAAYYQEDWYLEHTLVVFAGVNCGLAVIAALHRADSHNPLPAVVCLISTLAVFNNLAQVIEYTQMTVKISEYLTWALLLSLVFIPGRTGIVNDILRCIGSARDSWIRVYRHIRNSGGDS